MIPPRGWRDREARARHRMKPQNDPAVVAELEAFMHRRDAEIEAQRKGEGSTPVGIVTSATMLANQEAPAAPESAEAPEQDEPAPEAPEAAAPEAAADVAEETAPAPAPKSRAKKTA